MRDIISALLILVSILGCPVVCYMLFGNGLTGLLATLISSMCLGIISQIYWRKN